MRRRFMSTSEIDREYFLANVERQHVDNITIPWIYQSHTVTVLLFICVGLAYLAFTRSPAHTFQENLFHGIICIIVVFLFISIMIMPNGPFIRPHPAVWSLIYGVSLVYFLTLVGTLFLRLDEARAILHWLQPELASMRHSDILDKEYAVNCSQISLARVYSHMDVFALAHLMGWAVKAVLLRHRLLAWTLSINWEITEIAFSHILPNFNECWWDSIFLDILLCNGIGIELGMLICRWLEMRSYEWESIRDVAGARAKIKRVVLQFTPQSWMPTHWLGRRDSSFLRASYLFSLLILFWQLAELNCFFLKHVFIVKPSHYLTMARLALITLMSAPGIRQYYHYVTDPRVTRFGSQLWLFIATVVMETMVCFKLGSESFEPAVLRNFIYWFAVMLTSSFVSVIVCCWFSSCQSNDDGSTAKAQPGGDSKLKTSVVSFLGLGRQKSTGSDAEDEQVSNRSRFASWLWQDSIPMGGERPSTHSTSTGDKAKEK